MQSFRYRPQHVAAEQLSSLRDTEPEFSQDYYPDNIGGLENPRRPAASPSTGMFRMPGNRPTFADRLLMSPEISGRGPGCLLNMVASTWVYLYHAVFKNTGAIDRENSEIRMNLVQQDLASCAAKLAEREKDLLNRVYALTNEAIFRKRAGDIAGAKKKLVDRKRLQNQLDRLQNSISVIDMHINTIEGTELNKSILQTLKASGDALRKLGVEGGGIEGVESIVSEVESQVEYASEITKIISSANVSGTINTMGYDAFNSDEDLEKELEQLLHYEEDGGQPGGNLRGWDTGQPVFPDVPKEVPRNLATTSGGLGEAATSGVLQGALGGENHEQGTRGGVVGRYNQDG